MKPSLKHIALPVAVFITGACVLIIEVVATRVLSPYFGNTIFTISGVLSIILAALSIGYSVGGKLADKRASPQQFCLIILTSGIAVLGSYAVGAMLLPLLSVHFSLLVGPLISAALLFFAPALLLGMLSPYAVKLQTMRDAAQGVGSATGSIFFWSTLGSIGGSLLAGFVLIPHVGVKEIIIACGAVLFLLGVIPLVKMGVKGARIAKVIFIFALAVGATQISLFTFGEHIRYSRDGVYQHLTVSEGEYAGRPARFLNQDRSRSGGVFINAKSGTDLVYDITKYFTLYRLFTPHLSDALVIGGGPYAVPRALLSDSPDVHVSVAEIEPVLLTLAQRYFGLTANPRLRNYTEDGRRLLSRLDQTYDLIFSDVYYSLYFIPPHFTTQEFFTVAKSRLNHNGVFIANIVGDLSQQQPSFIFSEMRTFETIFPNSYFFAVDSSQSIKTQNIVFVGVNGDTRIDWQSPIVTSSPDSIIHDLQAHRIDTSRYALADYLLLTDNFAPVEYLNARTLSQ